MEGAVLSFPKKQNERWATQAQSTVSLVSVAM